MDQQELRDIAFVPNDELYNKKINPQTVPEKQIGIDLNDTVLHNIIDAVQVGQFDSTSLNSFTQVSRTRNELYDTLDYMGEDTTLASVLETYAEDATETNDNGQIVWCESDDAAVSSFVTYLIDALNIDKNVFRWAYSLCKYGDVYLRLYRESDYTEKLFDNSKTIGGKKPLTEDVVIKAYEKKDKYVHYLEMAPNPAQLFELTRFGKTAAYIKTDVAANTATADNPNTTYSILNKYSFNKNDVELYQPTEWVHGCLDGNSSRVIEEVELFINDEDQTKYTYQVKRGQSILYNTYKVWRQLMLLENSVLLNRVTQSSIVRVIGVEVGDMPKENIPLQMMNIKQLIEQKAAVNVGKSINEYTNPGPIVNNVYIPTREGKGVLSTTQIGGDVNVGELVDLDYYNNKLFGGLRVPKQYFGLTDDAAGFSGGQSLSIISSRYAKMIKHIQNIICQMITDAINLICIDTGNDAYVNKFTIRMLAPTTQEEVDRRDNLSSKVGLVRDIMDTLADIENPVTKLRILKNLLSNTITDTEVISLIEDEIESMEKAIADSETEPEEYSEEEYTDDGSYDSSYPDDAELDFGNEGDYYDEGEVEYTDETEVEDTEEETDDLTLPTPAELDIGDVSDANNPNFN